VNTVLDYISVLLKGNPSRAPVSENDIGILTPYTRQVHKLRVGLKKNGWENIEVGSAEAFQGREKRVIIISTVRSDRLGFVRDEKVCFFQNSSTILTYSVLLSTSLLSFK
jgi:hypothetical protein